MRDFREFEAGPDPFGRTWRVRFKWQQNGITLRHADTVDVKFVIETEGASREKVIALPHPELLRRAAETGRRMNDAWCSRLAALHLKHMIESGEDLEKDLVTVQPQDLARHDQELEAAGLAARA
ncbi:MAG: hypothetical protein IT158_25560 [Bryobacterales bacterium]|nr:hypothetical protein [Bryobacterales bacterium]